MVVCGVFFHAGARPFPDTVPGSIGCAMVKLCVRVRVVFRSCVVG